MNVQTLTMGELAKVEEISGVSINQMGDPETPKARMMIAIAFLTKKREDPSVKLSDIEALTLTDLQALIGDDSKSD